jgi:nucleoid DNA-binding protein
MSESISSRETIEKLVRESGIKKKLASEILHVIPVIIEEGLKRDGEVRVKGLGTFRMKWTRARTGRNPKTGERVNIPAHNRLVFLPEQSFKDFINRDYRLLSYKIIPSIGQNQPEEEIIPEPEHQPELQPEIQPEIQPESQPEPEPEPEITPKYYIESESQPEPQTIKRRIHWIVPVSISVIALLSLVFYFRNFYHFDKKSEDRSQKTEVGGQQSAVGGQQSADSGQQSAVGGQQSADSGQPTQIENRQSTIDNRQSARFSQQIISAGDKHLFQLAREVYSNPYLWVLIYKENQAKITDPDMLVSGMELVIPALEGKPGQLTRNDSTEVAEGYRLVYEFYKAKGDLRAGDFFNAMKKYKPI